MSIFTITTPTINGAELRVEVDEEKETGRIYTRLTQSDDYTIIDIEDKDQFFGFLISCGCENPEWIEETYRVLILLRVMNLLRTSIYTE